MIEIKENLKELIFICRRERWRRIDRLRLAFARRRKEKFASKKRHYYGDGRKKHVQSMFNTKYDKPFKYAYKSGLNKHLNTEVLASNYKAPNSSTISLRSMKNYVVYLEKTALKSVVGTLRWFIKMNCLQNEVKCRVNVFPDFVLTAKPKEMRMGKGKGAPSHKIAPIKPGAPFLEVLLKGPVPRVLLNKLMRAIRAKLPFQTKFFYNFW